MNLLFVCNLNKHRSRTAEDLVKKYDKYEVKSAGILASAAKPLTLDIVKWADIIFVFEQGQRDFIVRKFPYAFNIKIINLDIVDMYDYGVNSLVEQLKIKLKEYL